MSSTLPWFLGPKTDERLREVIEWPEIGRESRQSKTARALCETSRPDRSAPVSGEQSRKSGPPRARYPQGRSQKSTAAGEESVDDPSKPIPEMLLIFAANVALE